MSSSLSSIDITVAIGFRKAILFSGTSAGTNAVEKFDLNNGMLYRR